MKNGRRFDRATSTKTHSWREEFQTQYDVALFTGSVLSFKFVKIPQCLKITFILLGNTCHFLLHVLSWLYQGALYCLLGAHCGFSVASVRDWDCVGEVWPALVRCGLSPSMTLEKPSIGCLLDDITDRIHRQHDTIGIFFTVSSPPSSWPWCDLTWGVYEPHVSTSRYLRVVSR